MDVTHQLIFILQGVPATLAISIISFLLGLAIGLPLAFIRAYEEPISFLVDAYEKIFRGIPEIVLMLLFFFGLGLYWPFPFGNAWFTALLVLGLRSGANQSQIFRGAIRGVGDEQMVAGRSIGLSRWRSVLKIMVPQVFIFSTPGLGSEYALLIKDSSYVWIIGIIEVMERSIMLRQATYDAVTPYVIAALVYVMLTFPIAAWLDVWGNRKKKKLGF